MAAAESLSRTRVRRAGRGIDWRPVTRPRCPLHSAMAPPEVDGEAEHTREVVAGELEQWAQVATELAGKRHDELAAVGDPEAGRAAAQLAHEIAEQLRSRARAWR